MPRIFAVWMAVGIFIGCNKMRPASSDAAPASQVPVVPPKAVTATDGGATIEAPAGAFSAPDAQIDLRELRKSTPYKNGIVSLSDVEVATKDPNGAAIELANGQVATIRWEIDASIDIGDNGRSLLVLVDVAGTLQTFPASMLVVGPPSGGKRVIIFERLANSNAKVSLLLVPEAVDIATSIAEGKSTAEILDPVVAGPTTPGPTPAGPEVPVDAPPGPFEVTSSGTAHSRSPTFSWTSSEGAATYDLKVADNPEFASPMSALGLTVTSHSFGALPDKTYYIRVTAISATGKTTSASEASIELRTWRSTSLIGAPSARDDHMAVWSGKELIVWGGYALVGGDNIVFNNGGRYDPSTDTWRSVSTSDAPAARSRHTAIWTGTEMIVWGGNSEISGVLGDGGRYNPATDRWTPLVGGPAPRFWHAAFWTGTKMIVHGGQGNSGMLADGGIYDPSTDTWTAIPDIPGGVSDFHVYANMGPKLFAKKGFKASLYDFASNTWSLSASANYARTQSAVVWSGAEVILWGGWNFNGVMNEVMNDGIAYDPLSDTWRFLPTFNAPPASFAAIGMWTGTSAVFWGGQDFVKSIATGGVYNPATNSWKQLPAASAPTSRKKHTMTWTGTEGIVWGGSDFDDKVLQSGAVLIP